MNRNIILLLFILYICGVRLTASDGDPELEAYLREAIENFRQQMKNGIPAIKMPVLDPLELHNLDINVQENVAKIDLHIRKITIRSLSKFQIHDLQPNLDALFLKINLSLPEIKTDGEYKLNGMLLKIFPLYGDGNFQINVSSANIGGIGQLAFSKDTLQMTTLKLDLQWEMLKINLEKFLGGAQFAKVLQDILPTLGKGVFDHFKPQILKLMNRALIDEVNKELRKPEVKKIIEGILPSS